MHDSCLQYSAYSLMSAPGVATANGQTEGFPTHSVPVAPFIWYL